MNEVLYSGERNGTINQWNKNSEPQFKTLCYGNLNYFMNKREIKKKKFLQQKKKNKFFINKKEEEEYILKKNNITSSSKADTNNKYHLNSNFNFTDSQLKKNDILNSE